MLQDELLKTYEDVKDGIDAAPDSPVPFPVIKDEKISVVGDANETQIKPHDFKIKFEFPKGTVEGVETERGVMKEIEYTNVWVTPRQRAKVVSSMCKMFPFYRKIEERGGIDEYTVDEYAQLLSENGDDYVDAMYELVAKTLGVAPELVEYMYFPSVTEATVRIFKEYPDIVNEAESFFS